MVKLRPARSALLGALVLLVVASCERAPDAIDRETFVATYVDLRRAALESPGRRIRSVQRDSVLALHGVTEEDLLQFAEAHGRDIDYMAQVWAEVEARLHAPDSAAAPSP